MSTRTTAVVRVDGYGVGWGRLSERARKQAVRRMRLHLGAILSRKLEGEFRDGDAIALEYTLKLNFSASDGPKRAYCEWIEVRNKR
ncbi:hypothetical protein [Dokdonella soli]|uniref:hypothetical protein n=1 Tax=Dokdonella soli TaxID=529810 RepID=UPI0031CE416F